jgi:hypothetical protein
MFRPRSPNFVLRCPGDPAPGLSVKIRGCNGARPAWDARQCHCERWFIKPQAGCPVSLSHLPENAQNPKSRTVTGQ